MVEDLEEACGLVELSADSRIADHFRGAADCAGAGEN